MTDTQAHYIELDQSTHTYFVDGIESISVTQVLKLAGLVDDRWFTEFGRWRGSAVHLATKYFDEGDIDRRTLDPAVKPFVADWKKFREDTGFTPTLIEQPLYDSLYNFCGTPDRRGYFMGGDPKESNEIIDIKCYPGGHVPWWVRLQLAAYGRLIDPRRVFRRYAVILTGDGPVIEEYPSTNYVEDVDSFLACARVARLQLANS